MMAPSHAPQLSIGERMLSRDHPAFVIAEIGVNHDGSLQRALELVAHAARAGADAVKLQLFHAQTLVNPAATMAHYQKTHCADDSVIQMLGRYELSDDAVHRTIAAIKAAGMLPIATPFSLDQVGLIDQLDLPAIKIASPDLVNWPLLDASIQTGRPLLLSTGAATMDEVSHTVDRLNERFARYALLHCISSYPTPDGSAHLGWISELRHRFGCVLGYSDHTANLLSGALAVAAGACVIEKHLTYDRAACGPDHSSSADPQQFGEYIRLIRSAEQLCGQGKKYVLDIEQDVRRVSRQSLVLAQSLEAGQVLQKSNLIIQRPGTGIPAARRDEVVGRALKVVAPAGSLLTWEMLS